MFSMTLIIAFSVVFVGKKGRSTNDISPDKFHPPSYTFMSQSHVGTHAPPTDDFAVAGYRSMPADARRGEVGTSNVLVEVGNVVAWFVALHILAEEAGDVRRGV